MDNAIVVNDNEEIVRQRLDLTTIKDAAKADAEEHRMSVWDAFQTHKKAIFWSMALSGA